MCGCWKRDKANSSSGNVAGREVSRQQTKLAGALSTEDVRRERRRLWKLGDFDLWTETGMLKGCVGRVVYVQRGKRNRAQSI